MSNRRVRKVPENWSHPVDKDGRFIPLFDGSEYLPDIQRWDIESEKWKQGFYSHRELITAPHPSLNAAATFRWKTEWLSKDSLSADLQELSFEEWDGPRPKSEDYMPVWGNEADRLMMYEECTEGTPLSPAFSTKEELADWLAKNNVSVFGNYCCDDATKWLEIIDQPHLAMPVLIK